MSRGFYVLVAATVVLFLPAWAAPVPKDYRPLANRENSNALLKEHRATVKTDASSEYQGWPIANSFDGESATAWYSNSGDAPMNNTTPWVRVTFTDDVNVRRVTIVGSRDPNYPNGYFITAGKFELLDKGGAVLRTMELKSTGDKHDFDWIIDRPPAGVRAVRFTATKDQGQYSCVAISEFQVE